MLRLRATASQGIAECTSLEVARRPMWASFGRADGGVRRGVVTEPPPEARRPCRAHAPEDCERPAPADALDQDGRQERGDGTSYRGRREQQPLRPPALLIREPARQDPGHVRQGPRLAGAEEEPHGDERPEARARPRERRERRPPERDPRQHATPADPIPPPAGRDLEQSVGQRERHEDVAGLRVRQSQVGLDRVEGGGHADPVEVQDARERAEDAQHRETGSRRRRDHGPIGIPGIGGRRRHGRNHRCREGSNRDASPDRPARGRRPPRARVDYDADPPGHREGRPRARDSLPGGRLADCVPGPPTNGLFAGPPHADRIRERRTLLRPARRRARIRRRPRPVVGGPLTGDRRGGPRPPDRELHRHLAGRRLRGQTKPGVGARPVAAPVPAPRRRADRLRLAQVGPRR